MRYFLSLLLVVLCSSCAQMTVSENDFIGTWLITRSDGYLEKLSLYPDHRAAFGGREFTKFSWVTSVGELELRYENNGKVEILRYKIGRDRSEILSTKNVWFSNDIHFSGRKISPIPNKNFDLFEVATKYEDSKTWECINIGSGGHIYSTVLQTSLTLESCKSKCEEHIKAWHDTGVNEDEYCK